MTHARFPVLFNSVLLRTCQCRGDRTNTTVIWRHDDRVSARLRQRVGAIGLAPARLRLGEQVRAVRVQNGDVVVLRKSASRQAERHGVPGGPGKREIRDLTWRP